MLRSELSERLARKGMGRYEDNLIQLSRSCIRLYLTKISDADIPLGSSKMGGLPDLPPSISWPYETERPTHDRDRFFDKQLEIKPLLPLSFIAQINLEEVSSFSQEKLLPGKGILYFFYSAEQEVWGFDPRDSSGFKVIYYEGSNEELIRTPFPNELPSYSRFDSCIIKTVEELSLPTPWSNPIDGLFENADDENSYNELYDEFPANKIFGYADLIQGEMELECELATNGIYVGGPEGYSDPRRKTLEANVDDWLLLLQVDSNEETCGMMWGDVGRIYYWIRKNDLIDRNFDKSWLILQCS